jgi:hypothetical protein
VGQGARVTSPPRDLLLSITAMRICSSFPSLPLNRPFLSIICLL